VGCALTEELPVIDFAEGDEAAIARRLDAALAGTGFCYFRNIGVDAALVEAVFEASRRFHALPRAAGMRGNSA
jgi:isopenicillin N synthase-like dioxygenase